LDFFNGELGAFIGPSITQMTYTLPSMFIAVKVGVELSGSLHRLPIMFQIESNALKFLPSLPSHRGQLYQFGMVRKFLDMS
jgi:hypothetical protein